MEQLRKKFQSLTLEERRKYIKSLSKKERKALLKNPELFLFDKQIITGEQRYTILKCGRSFGKSYSGAAWIARKILNGAKVIGLVGANHKDVEQVMVKFILSWFPNDAVYVGGDQAIIKFKSRDAIIYCYSSETEIRGPNLEYLWCDEVCKWCSSIAEKAKECFDCVDMAVRVGKNPQIIITSTPKPFPLFFEWKKKIEEGNKRYKLMEGTMWDNPFLGEDFIQSMVEKFGNTRFGRQELYGDLLEDVEGAAWDAKMIEDCQMSFEEFKEKIKETITHISETGHRTTYNKFEILRTVIGVDPTVSDKPDNDECGIISASLGSDGHIYVFKDNSGQYTTDEWAQKSVYAYYEIGAGLIVIEKNNGGELVKKNILAVDSSIIIKPISSTKGKLDRALPIAALYERRQVHHVQPKGQKDHFIKLENQMTKYTGNPKLKSPDRLDALVFAIMELKLNETYAERDFSAIGVY